MCNGADTARGRLSRINIVCHTLLYYNILGMETENEQEIDVILANAAS
jgi:hypothetical protein